jgi:SnoaL-like domain/Rho termination factor, N-terminal domain
MTKAELDSKHIAELHDLAAEAGVERYRMLSRAELIEKLAGGGGEAKSPPKCKGERRGGDSGRSRQRDRGRSREPRGERPREPKPKPAEPEPKPTPAAPSRGEAERPKRKRRRRRWGRRRKGGGIREHADRWLEAWNGHDLDEIVSCYSERIEFVLPALVGDGEERKIDGREELREHFRHGLELAPNLTVTEESLLVGPGGFAILYRREDGHRAIEAVELDGDGLAAKVRTYYERD